MSSIDSPLKSRSLGTASSTMQALVYRGHGKPSWELHPRPSIQAQGDAIVRITTTTICGTDLHILKGDLPSVSVGRILGHEGVGLIEEVGPAVAAFHRGDRVLVSCITSCGKCDFCRKQMYSHCRHGGWMLGNSINGTQAEYVRIPFADTSLYAIPADMDVEAAVLLSDTFPTGYECGVLNGRVQPGDTVAIVGAGPVGLAALLTSHFYSPGVIIAIDLDDNRLQAAKRLGARLLVNSSDGSAVQKVMELTDSQGVDVAIEAVGVPATFDICQGILAAGGRLANIGVHGKPVSLHLETLWDRNATLTTGLVDGVSTPLLLKAMTARQFDPSKLVTHRFAMKEILKAYDTFENAAQHGALKVVLQNS